MDSEQALRDALAFAESIIDTIRDPLLVLDADLRVVMASRAFYDLFAVAPEETVGRLVYELGNRQWDIPALRTLLEEVLPQKVTFRDFEVDHTFERIGRRVVLLNACRVRRKTCGQILLSIEDVTERRAAEEARRQAETRFTEMVKNVRDHSIFLTDPEGRVTSWNVAAERVIGYSEAEALGQHFSMIFTPEDVKAGLPEQELRQAREWGRAEDERWHQRKGGERFWALGIVTPLRDAQGNVTGYSKILRDMTERKQAEDALRLTEERFQRAMNIGTVGVLCFRLDGRILEANAAFERMSGYRAEELRALPDWAALTAPEFREASARAAAELAERGETAPYEKQMLRKNGSRWWGLFAPARLSGSGAESECIEFVIDVGQAKQAEAELRQSEARYRLIVEGTRDYAIFTTDAQGRITSWPAGAEAVYGWSAAETVGQDLAMTFTPEDRAAGAPEWERATARAKGSAPDVRWHLRKGGARVFIEGVTRALGEDFLKIGQDVTARRRSEEALRASEERLRVALAAGQMGTWLWRIPQDEQILDDSLRRLMGLGKNVLKLEEFLGAVHAQDRGHVRAEFERCQREGCDLNVEFRVTWPDGSVHWLKDQGKTLEGPDGPFMTGAAMDITDRKRMEEELREADRRKDEFLAMLGHELRNPLAPLRGVLDRLQRRRLEGPELERAVAMMDRQVNHLTRLVEDLLDVSRITRGLIELRSEPVNLADVVGQAVEMATPAIEGRSHDLNLSLPRRPIRVKGDATRLTQIVFNLLNNAAKYTDPGGKIWLAVERDGDAAVVRVRDNGAGMPPELVGRVFELFTQGQRSLDRSQGGLGLGLTLVKRLTEMHGGTVEASSPGVGKGSEFVVRLPALPAEEASPRPPAPPAEAGVGRVLVVDDNPDVAESMAFLLEGLADQVRAVFGGAQALDVAPEFKPDLIICDIGMPGMDGYETARRLRQLPGLENIPLVAVSGYGQEEDRQRSRAAGFDYHLVKPAGREELQAIIRERSAAAQSRPTGPA